MRVFIATDINDEVRKSIGDLQNKLQSSLAFDKGIKWVNPEIMHLTLKFLGEVKDNILNDVCKITEQVAVKCPAFNLDIEGAGHFGGRSARVVWVGTGQGSEQLAEMANELDEQLQTLGFAPETRQFTGHLTLCRIKNVKAGFELAKAAERYRNFQAGTVAVDSITVYQSQLSPDGPTYTPLARYDLR